MAQKKQQPKKRKKALGKKAMKKTKGGLQEGPLAVRGMQMKPPAPGAGQGIIDPSYLKFLK